MSLSSSFWRLLLDRCFHRYNVSTMKAQTVISLGIFNIWHLMIIVLFSAWCVAVIRSNLFINKWVNKAKITFSHHFSAHMWYIIISFNIIITRFCHHRIIGGKSLYKSRFKIGAVNKNNSIFFFVNNVCSGCDGSHF